MQRARMGFLLLLLLAGCNSQDTDALKRLSKKALARSQAWTGDVKTGPAGTWAAPLELGLEARVAARLKWDKQLADTSIEVKLVGNNCVEVKGKVRDLEQHRRVVMLLETTMGVEEVRDLLEERN